MKSQGTAPGMATEFKESQSFGSFVWGFVLVVWHVVVMSSLVYVAMDDTSRKDYLSQPSSPSSPFFWTSYWPKTSEKVFHRRNTMIVGFAPQFIRLGNVRAISSHKPPSQEGIPTAYPELFPCARNHVPLPAQPDQHLLTAFA